MAQFNNKNQELRIKYQTKYIIHDSIFIILLFIWAFSIVVVQPVCIRRAGVRFSQGPPNKDSNFGWGFCLVRCCGDEEYPQGACPVANESTSSAAGVRACPAIALATAGSPKVHQEKDITFVVFFSCMALGRLLSCLHGKIIPCIPRLSVYLFCSLLGSLLWCTLPLRRQKPPCA